MDVVVKCSLIIYPKSTQRFLAVLHAYLHRLPEDGSDLDVHPLSCCLIPVQVFSHPVVEVFDRLEVAEANVQAVMVRREGVDGIALEHPPVLGAFELAKVGEPPGHAHALFRLEAVPEDVLFVLEEGESFGAFHNFHLRTFFILGHDEPFCQHG